MSKCANTAHKLLFKKHSLVLLLSNSTAGSRLFLSSCKTQVMHIGGVRTLLGAEKTKIRDYSFKVVLIMIDDIPLSFVVLYLNKCLEMERGHKESSPGSLPPGSQTAVHLKDRLLLHLHTVINTHSLPYAVERDKNKTVSLLIPGNLGNCPYFNVYIIKLYPYFEFVSKWRASQGKLETYVYYNQGNRCFVYRDRIDTKLLPQALTVMCQRRNVVDQKYQGCMNMQSREDIWGYFISTWYK